MVGELRAGICKPTANSYTHIRIAIQVYVYSYYTLQSSVEVGISS